MSRIAYPTLDRLSRTPGATRVLLALGILAAATAVGLLESSQVQYDRALRGEPITWSHALMHGLPRWYIWSLLAPLVVLITRTIHARGVSRPAVARLHVMAGAAIVFLHVLLFAVASEILHGSPDPLARLRPAMLKYINLTYLGGVLTYAALVGGWYGLELSRRSRAGEKEAARLALEASRLETLLMETRLQRLQAQLEPHFLFNSLNTLSGLILQGDTRTAVRTTRRLSELLRSALRASERSEHSVADEVALVEEYLAIQQLRFEDRMGVRIDVDPRVRDAAIPTLMLQPLVENAVLHGIEAVPTPGTVTVRVEQYGDRLVATIRNDGPPLGSTLQKGEGVGLRNVRSRLDTLYAGDGTLTLSDVDGGVQAMLEIPIRPAAPASAEVAASPQASAP